MELTLFSLHPPTFVIKSCPHPSYRRINTRRNIPAFRCCSLFSSVEDAAKSTTLPLSNEGRRALISCLLFAAAGLCISDVAGAVSTSRRALRGAKIPESDFTTLPNGLNFVSPVTQVSMFVFSRYYDLKVGSGPIAIKRSRVAPYGFDVGESERGRVLKGLDLGVQGMRVGGQRLLIVPPELAYGEKGVQEIPPNATIEVT
ncbi:hypothetical protein Cgig2_025979 [Carnegiea gigantea]|uniref:peptidylprolyl isomerase n=1 Tax=Carnegiea gigantea TaxID=171969 RepID=A0A9Q1JGV6_9CARY|nr:hypothetical protein Cgig2_025979 [Carnegiea gigantea]